MKNIDNNMLDRNFLKKYHHDMREPLRNISNFLQIIKMDLAHEKSKSNNLLYYINNAINCLNILDDFNNSILNFSDNFNKKQYNLNLIINKIVCLLSDQIIKRKCIVDIQDDIPLLKCHPIDLFRIFKNLIENAIKYAICEELFVKISLVNKLENNIVLLFEDNGKELSSNIVIEIKNLLKDNIENSNKNFGLPMVKELITKNNGSIKLLENNIGCAYEITLECL